MLWLAPAAVLVSLAQGMPLAEAAGLGGTIQGSLVENTPGAQLQAGGKAYLYALHDNQQPDQAGEADVDAGGRFSFDFVPIDAGQIYEVGMQYQGVPYFSDRITFASGESQRQVSLNVYEAGDDDSALALAQTSLLVEPDEQTHELAVLELDTFMNGSQRAFLPNTTPRNGGPPPLLRFSLPPNATDLNPGQGLLADEIIQISTGFGALAPLLPGRHDLGFSYRVAYQTSNVSFSKNVIYPTQSFRVLVAVGRGQIDSPQLVTQPLQTIGGRQFQLLMASDLPAGSKLDLRFSRLPGVSPLAVLSQPEALPWLALSLGAVVLALLGWYLRDRRKLALAAPDGSAGEIRRQLEMERRELLIVLARLDDRYDEGSISSDDYNVQREAGKSELHELIRRIEALPAGPAAG